MKKIVRIIINNHCYYVCPSSSVYVMYRYMLGITREIEDCRRFFITSHPYEQSIEESNAIEGFQSIKDFLDDTKIIKTEDMIKGNTNPTGLAVAKV